MKNTIVVVTDLACLKAYRLEKSQMNHAVRLEPLDQFDNDAAHARLTDTVSDSSGRFPRGAAGTTGGMSDGERHNIQLEQRRRLVRQLAARLSHVLKQTEAEACYLAASREIHNQLLDELEPRSRNIIVRNVHADLTKVDRQELLAHF